MSKKKKKKKTKTQNWNPLFFAVKITQRDSRERITQGDRHGVTKKRRIAKGGGAEGRRRGRGKAKSEQVEEAEKRGERARYDA